METIRKLLPLLILASMNAYAGWFGPSNYDECILESMKGVTNNVAAAAVNQACRRKFPEKALPDYPLPAETANKITGRASASYGYFSGAIYNGSRDWSITQVTVAIWPKSKKTDQGGAVAAKEYNIDVSIPPLTNKDFIVSIEQQETNDFSWNIVKVRGRKAP